MGMELVMHWTKDKQQTRHQVALVIWDYECTHNISIQTMINDVKDRYHNCWDETNISDKELTVIILEILLKDAIWDVETDDLSLEAMFDKLGV